MAERPKSARGVRGSPDAGRRRETGAVAGVGRESSESDASRRERSQTAVESLERVTLKLVRH